MRAESESFVNSFQQYLHNQVKERAFALWKKNGGDPYENWINAEIQIQAEGFRPKACQTVTVYEKRTGSSPKPRS